jgi:hypothetical protein
LRDSYPNKWFIEATSGVDRAIHECFYTPETLQRLLGSQEPTSENAPADVAATAGTAGSYQIGEVQARSWMVFGRVGPSPPFVVLAGPRTGRTWGFEIQIDL